MLPQLFSGREEKSAPDFVKELVMEKDAVVFPLSCGLPCLLQFAPRNG